MTISSPSYHSIKNVAYLIMGFIIIFILFDIDNLLSDKVDTRTFRIYWIIFIVALSLSLYWYYQATKNIQSFGTKEITSPVKAIIWWFVPVYFFWKPYIITQQLWKASNPKTILASGTEWKNSPNSKIIKVWWILAVVSFFGPIIQGGMTAINLIPEVNDEVNDIVTNPFSIISYIGATLFMLIIRQISQWQELKVHENIS